MIDTKNLFRLLSLSLSLCVFTSNQSSAQDVEERKDVDVQQDTVVYKPTKITHFLDGKQVPEYIIVEKGNEGKIGDGSSYTGPRMAIRTYGEKYRNGVVFWSSKN